MPFILQEKDTGTITPDAGHSPTCALCDLTPYAEPAVAQYTVELEVLYPGALGQSQAVVGGGHGEVGELVLDRGIMLDCNS